ncbi:hypothetical protein PMAYCL1PPCAC_10379, partial [Pristionchus mayeri]
FEDLHTASSFISSPLAIVIIVLSVITLSLSLLYSTLIYVVLAREKFRGHKRTAIVADRSAATIDTILLLYIALIIWHTTGYYNFCFYIHVCTSKINIPTHISDNFFVITILMCVAVMKPKFYATRVKFRHCIMLGWTFAVVSVTLNIILGLGASALFFPIRKHFPVSSGNLSVPLRHRNSLSY